jgi:uncharacterized repeat protein (TIGR01451 family)
VTIANSGPSTAADVMLTDDLPDDVQFLGHTVSNGTGTCQLLAGPANVLECDLNDLAPGEFVTVYIETMVNSDVHLGEILCNTATASSATTESAPGDEMVTECTDVLAGADLALSKDASLDTGSPSYTWIYTLVVSNLGATDAPNVMMTDTLPLTYKKAVFVFDTGNGACTYDRGAHEVYCGWDVIPAGDSRSVDIHIRFRGSQGRVNNVATATSSVYDPNPANNTDNKEILIAGSTDGPDTPDKTDNPNKPPKPPKPPKTK